jgi:hypothetical protein
MGSKSEPKNDIKKIFMSKGACSHTGFYVLNREFGHNKPNEERASDLLAGGLANKGFQCGMLWGCSLAVGGECYRKYNNSALAALISIETTQQIIASFIGVTGTPHCKEMTRCDFSSPLGLIKYMIINLPKGLTNTICFNVAEQWLPVAAEIAGKKIGAGREKVSCEVISCASEVIRLSGGSDEEIATVSGLAGGLGLSGNACGALAAAIWFYLLDWCREHPGKIPSYFNNRIVKVILKRFFKVSNKQMLCSQICDRQFRSVKEHTDFIKNNGCAEIIKALTKKIA